MDLRCEARREHVPSGRPEQVFPEVGVFERGGRNEDAVFRAKELPSGSKRIALPLYFFGAASHRAFDVGFRDRQRRLQRSHGIHAAILIGVTTTTLAS